MSSPTIHLSRTHLLLLLLGTLAVACDDGVSIPRRSDGGPDSRLATAADGGVHPGGAVDAGGSSGAGTIATGGVASGGSAGSSAGGVMATGGAVSSGGVPGTSATTSNVDARLADAVPMDARRGDTAGLDGGTPRDAREDTSRDSGTRVPMDSAPGDASIDSRAGFANCPVNSGTTPLPPPGEITWSLSMSSSPTSAERDAYNRIIPAMNTAVCIYSAYTTLTKRLTVQYNPNVTTADGTTDGASATGNIRFGSTASMNYVTAMHEMAHTFGVGGTKFNSMCVNGVFSGMNATAELRAITGESSDVVKCGGSHFWPYGLNYTSEWKDNSEGKNHCRMVLAVRKDLGL